MANYSNWNSVVEYVVNNLKELILSGKFTVGDRFLTENEICTKYNVSRSSAREALRILSAVGYLEISRGRGAFVSSIDDSDFSFFLKNFHSENSQCLRKVIEARLMLEPSAVAKAAECRSEENLKKILAIFNEMQDAFDKHDVTSVSALDEKFHMALVDATENEYLSRINAFIQKNVSAYRAKIFRVEPYFPLAQTEHRNILNAIVEKDSAAAQKMVKEHILTIENYYSAILKLS